MMTDQKPVFNWQFFLGFILVAAGGLFLADQFLEIQIMRNFWPLLVVLFGLMFFVMMILARRRGAWLAIPGAVITIAGIILYVHNTFDLWVTWTYAWALLISAVGIGMLIMNAYLKRGGLRTAAGWVIGIGLVLFVIFGIFFEIIMDLAGLSVNSGVFLGSGLVLLGLFVVLSRLIFSTKPKKTITDKRPLEPKKEVAKEVEAESPLPAADQPLRTDELKKETMISLDEGVEFTQMIFDAAGDVFIDQGSICTLRAEGDQDLIDQVKTEVEEDTLSIIFETEEQGLKKLKWIGEESKIKYFITLKSLGDLTLSGAGNVHADTLSGESLRILHSGEGRLILKGLNYQELQVSMEGLGEIFLEGEVQSQDVDLSGLGTIKAEDLRSRESNVTVSGAGTARVWAEEELNATLTGAGSILYKGQPEIEKSIRGLGHIKPLETE
jgi:hypothetical protein